MRFIKTLVVLVLGLLFLSPSLAWAAKIAVVKNDQIQFYNQFLSGLRSELNDISVSEYNVEDADALNQVRNSGYDLICALGTVSAKTVKDAFTDKPIVFSMLLSPVESGILNSDGPAVGNVTGVSLNVAVDDQLALIKKLLPSVRKIGLLYGPGSYSLFSRAQAYGAKEGLAIVGSSVQSSTGVPAALRALRPNVDALLVLPENKIWSKDSLQFLVQFTVESKLPAMGFASYLSKAGLLLAYSYDFVDLGKQTADLINKVLKAGTAIGSTPETTRKLNYVINSKIADNLGINFSPDIISGADTVYN